MHACYYSLQFLLGTSVTIYVDITDAKFTFRRTYLLSANMLTASFVGMTIKRLSSLVKMGALK